MMWWNPGAMTESQEAAKSSGQKEAKTKLYIVKWDLKPISLQNLDKPCEKKTLEMSKPSGC